MVGGVVRASRGREPRVGVVVGDVCPDPPAGIGGVAHLLVAAGGRCLALGQDRQPEAAAEARAIGLVR